MRSFYETNLTNAGTIIAKHSSTPTDAATVKSGGTWGDLFSQCYTAKLGAYATAKVACWSMVIDFFATSAKVTANPNRVAFDNANTASATGAG